jgi:hypothetical protein
MFYIVPQENQDPEGFVIPEMNGLRVALPLETNTMEKVLRPLAFWLNIRGAQSLPKAALIQGIKAHLSLLPMSDAVARWSDLDIAQLATMSQHEVGNKISWLILWDRAIARETPEFLPHYGKVREDVAATLRTLNDEVARKRWKEQRAAREEPEWLSVSTREPPASSHYKITVEQVDQGHDGYCTGTEEEDLRSDENTRKTIVLYVPADGWTAEQIWNKMKWKTHLGSHCCCGAATLNQIIAWEKVTV